MAGILETERIFEFGELGTLLWDPSVPEAGGELTDLDTVLPPPRDRRRTAVPTRTVSTGLRTKQATASTTVDQATREQTSLRRPSPRAPEHRL